MNDSPLISVIIPTRHRPQLLLGAIKTVLHQTLTQLEVIVIIDGPDSGTLTALAEIDDARLRAIALPENVGGSDARNIGVRSAKGEWIAFLDDDDEWLPTKLERQLPVALNSCYEYPIVATALIARTARAEFQWPRKPPRKPISEYLLARDSWTQGEGLLQTSTLFTARELLLKCHFRSGLRRHQDWDWLLRATSMPRVGVEYVPEALAIWNVEESRRRVSVAEDWNYSLEWIRQQRPLVTRRAYAGFIATQLSFQAAATRDWKAFAPLLKEMVRVGKPRPIDLLLYFMMWFTPKEPRRWLRRVSRGYKRTLPSTVPSIDVSTTQSGPI